MTVSTNHNFWRERRAEAVLNQGPSAYQPTALPLGQTDSLFLLLYILTDIATHIATHQYTCSVSVFFFGITCTVTFPLICLGTYTQIYQEINLPVYLHTFPLSNNKYLPVTITTCIPAHRCTLSWPYLFIFNISTALHDSVYLHASHSSNHKDLPVTTATCMLAHRYTCSLPYLFILIISFRQTICTYLSSHLLF